MRMMKKIGGGRPGADPDYNEEVDVLEEEDDLLAMLEDEEEADAEANNNQSNYAKSNNSSEEFYDFGTYEEFLIAKVAESLRFIRRSSERAKAASELRWQQAINAFLQRQLLYQKEEENKTEEENHKKKQQMKDNDAKERADLFERERRSLEGKVKSALTANLCLFSVLGKKCSPIHLNVASKQKWYHCLDCEIVKSSVCCEVCARICHSGHRLVRKDTTGGEFDRGNLLMLRCECKEKLGMGECGPNGSRETYVWDNSLHGQHMRIENAATTVRKLQSSWYCIALGSVNGHGFTSGLHYWELTSEEAVEWTIGVATASITSMDNYLGNDRFSWAYETSGWIKHEANTMTYGEPFTDQDTMGILLDMDKHQLSFCKNGRNLGVAYHNISSTEEVFPAVAWRDGTVTVLPAQSTCRCMPKDEEELAVKLEASMEEDTTYLQLLDLSAKWSNSNTLGGSFSSNSRSRAIANPLSSSSSSSSEQLQQTKLCLISRDISLLSDKVEDLRLDGNELTDEAIEQLCRLTPSKLKRLHLSRNRLTKFPVALCSKPFSAFTSATAYSSSSFILSSSKNNHANTPSSSSHSNNNANANANLITLQANNKHQQLNPLLTTERRASSPLISSPSLTHFTPSFSQLAFLDLSHNCLFPSLPFSIVQLSNLRILNLSHNKLSYLPQQFSQLTSLLELDLSSNLFSTPSPMETTQHIKEHERQRRCFLDCNHLPTSLTDLDLSNNPRVVTYPSGLERCTRLTTLSLSGLPYLLSLDPTTQTNEKREDEPRADKKKEDCLKAKQEYKRRRRRRKTELRMHKREEE
ncbi:Protein kinase domain-containing protein [Balamuthia mandrillaris]